MKKETLVAIFLGVTAGILIAVFLILNSKKASESGDLIISRITPTVVITNNIVEPLLIESPDDNITVDVSEVKISGTSAKDSLIVIQTPAEESVIKVKEKSFSSDVKLIPGENIIKITSYSGKEIDTRTLTVYYVEED